MAVIRDGTMQPSKPQPIQRTDGICREAERRAITGVPTSSWYALQEKGLAPKPVRLGPRSVGWSRAALLDWAEARIAESKDAWQSLGDAAARVVEKVRP
jgi:predicted DNA-binding transcriptional regulator AlpA